MKRIVPAILRGPLADSVMERLKIWLRSEGYCDAVCVQVLSVARGLSLWMEQNHVTLDGLKDSSLSDYTSCFGPGVPGHYLVCSRINVIRRFLIAEDLLPDAEICAKRLRLPDGHRRQTLKTAACLELDEWAKWQSEQRAIGAGCIGCRRTWVSDFVDELCPEERSVDWSACTLAAVNAYVARRSAGFAPSSATTLVSAIRSLIQWAFITGRVDCDLSAGVLRASSTRVNLPRGLSSDDIRALLRSCNVNTAFGIRDFAVITSLYRLGLRAGELSGLMMEDIDWASQRLCVVGKGPRRLCLPIPIDVGQALVQWLKVRPTGVETRAVFVRLRAPIGRLSSAGVSDIVIHRADAAGLGNIRAHRLRHTAAMNVIGAGGSLREAQQLLGHRTLNSTQTYARVDFESLRPLAIPFGQVPR